MTSYNTLKLRKGKEISLDRKHPWIFSGAFGFIPKELKNGEIISIIDYQNDVLAVGHFQEKSTIAVRVLSFEDKVIDLAFWKQVLAKAQKYRFENVILNLKITNCYRLIHGEGDGLPGLIIDIYHDIAVIQCHSQGMYESKNDIATALDEIYALKLDTIYIRTKGTLYDSESENSEASKSGQEGIWLKGAKDETMVLENGHSFTINVVTGQKTGFFLDQRDNRALLGNISEGKSILNCFCYTGGFSIYALCNGATYVQSVDISQTAMDALEVNLAANKYKGDHLSITANVMQFLNDESIPAFDIVIVDPPAFAKSIHKRHNAVQAYKRLNISALKKVKPGGVLLTFSCSQVVGTQLFYDTIVAAGMESGRTIRVMKSLSQGADHPVNLFHPEGHYLKGLVLHVE